MATPRFPAEWEDQAATLLTWPRADTAWRPWLRETEACYVAMATAIARYQPVWIVVPDRTLEIHVHGLLRDLSPRRLRFLHAPTNDTWIRDYGPITVSQGEQAKLLDWHFRGWGGKFDSAKDNASTHNLHASGAFGPTAIEQLDTELEGGAIDTDGEGTLLTTTGCLLHGNRNPGMSEAGYEQIFAQRLGCDRVLWLRHGHLEGDDTDGHVDTLARFTDSQTIVYVGCDNPADPHFSDLQAMEKELLAFRDRSGAPYRCIALPWPGSRFDEQGERLPVSYANFLIINGAVLAPVYDDPADDLALSRLAECFPERDIVPIHALPLIRQYGSVHCATMQLPAAVAR
ncbi:MAG: agmatine deiminase family protein [Chromatiales bacterium]|nr:agmatine deiminase family protein [Chromatiales bacterium]